MTTPEHVDPILAAGPDALSALAEWALEDEDLPLPPADRAAVRNWLARLAEAATPRPPDW